MGVTNLAAICRTLIRLGKPGATPAAIIESGTTATQRVQVGTLETIALEARHSGVRPPALLVVGNVVKMRDELSWYERLPLFGQRIVVTRPRAESVRAAVTLEALGAEVLVAPTVEIRPLAEPAPLDAAIERLADYQWLVFTSANGVRFFMRRLQERRRDLRALGHLKLAAIGPETARALGRFSLVADLVPESYRSEALAAALSRAGRGRRILLARADRGRTVLKDELVGLADVDQVSVYHHADVVSLPQSVLARIQERSVDWITLTSSGITTRLYELIPPAERVCIGAQIKLASISPVTSETAVNLGWKVAVEATEHTWQGLVSALLTHVRRVP
jgi:uroporphyrinogen III methyltransferase/synthase